MANIKVYLANLAGVSDDTMTNVTNILSSYFNRVVSGTGSTFEGVIVVTSNNGLSVRKSDLLCYIVGNFGLSKVKLFNPAVDHLSSDYGVTSFTRKFPYIAASEVYADEIEAIAQDAGMAYSNLIFHELMHNKGALGDELHYLGGAGLSLEEVSETSSLTDDNCTYMKGLLDVDVQQFMTSF